MSWEKETRNRADISMSEYLGLLDTIKKLTDDLEETKNKYNALLNHLTKHLNEKQREQILLKNVKPKIQIYNKPVDMSQEIHVIYTVEQGHYLYAKQH